MIDLQTILSYYPQPVAENSALRKHVLLSALLARAKGRDFYDVIFLWQQTGPDYAFLERRCGIATPDTLKDALHDKIGGISLAQKQKDFEHLLPNPMRSAQILHFPQFADEMLW